MRLQLLVAFCILHSIRGHNIENSYNDAGTTDLIGGGKTAPEGLARFQCSLQYHRKHICGCAVIDEYFVLTAGHCVVKRSVNHIRIMVGSNSLRANGTEYPAERVIPHELYNTPEFSNDVALVKVYGIMKFNENVQPIELGYEGVPDGAEVQLSGWGDARDSYIPNRLQYVKLHILAKNVCKKAHSGSFVRDDQFCTINLSGGACEADSGGPLVYQNKLVGIVNYGRPCDNGKPDVYANVSYFADWITDITSDPEQLSPPDKDDGDDVVDDDIKELNSAGSRPVLDGLAPFQCSLQHNEEHICGCAVIDKYFVLTASHCLVKKGKHLNGVKIMVGSNSLTKDGQYYDAERLITNEHYNKPPFSNDVALVKLQQPIEFKEKIVEPIKLGDRNVPIGAEVQLTGWGYFADGLQYIMLNTLEKGMCRKGSYGNHIKDQHFCTINLSGGPCQADKGGPLVYDNKLVGIANFGRPCRNGNPDVYADVSYFADWISKQITTDPVHRS